MSCSVFSLDENYAPYVIYVLSHYKKKWARIQTPQPLYFAKTPSTLKISRPDVNIFLFFLSNVNTCLNVYLAIDTWE